MKKAKQTLDRNFVISDIDKRLYGVFLEPIRDIVYGNVYNPDHPSSDENGFRTDVMDLLRELKTTLIRAPGGNYISGYHWKDGIGPREKRMVKKDLAWLQIDDNRVGIDEYALYNRLLGTEFMIAANLGTGTPEEAAEEVDYCNTKSGTYWSELRRKNGYEEPHNLKLWCVGNEMDGFWQICSKTPEEYGRICEEAAKMMKWMDPTIECVACGSCSNEIGLDTFPEWDRIVLDHAYEYVDYLSLHRYYSYDKDVHMAYDNVFCIEDLPYFALDLDHYVDTVLAAADFIKGKKRLQKKINISFDEWGVQTSCGPNVAIEGEDWSERPQGDDKRFSNLIDALIYGMFLIYFLNKSDRIKIACESVVIDGMIAADANGGAFKQSTFYPFQQVATYGHGVVLRQNLYSDTVATKYGGDVPAVQSAAVYNEKDSTVTVFVLNLDLRNEIEFTTDLRSFGNVKLMEHIQMYDDQPLAVNTFEQPERIVPVSLPVDENETSFILPKHSWHVLRYQVEK